MDKTRELCIAVGEDEVVKVYGEKSSHNFGKGFIPSAGGSDNIYLV